LAKNTPFAWQPGQALLNEIFSKGFGLPDMTHPPHNKFYELYTIVEVFDEPLPILKKLFRHICTKTSMKWSMDHVAHLVVGDWGSGIEQLCCLSVGCCRG
jgi:hypothetical protein